MTHESDLVLESNICSEMREHFTESELVELGLYFALVTGLQKFNKVFQISYGCEI